MTADAPYSHPFRIAALAQRKPTRFDLIPSVVERSAIAAALGLIDLPHARLKGEIRPVGRHDFTLEAELVADVVQPCVITLAPVSSHISDHVSRRYLADWTEPVGEESEVPEDDTAEALPEIIDAGQILIEALSLALPLYPRADGAEFAGVTAAETGADPLTDEKLKPFAGLADLLKGKGN
jgi:uncharacterized metal-binding protein YceD (DUF177 family)